MDSAEWVGLPEKPTDKDKALACAVLMLTGLPAGKAAEAAGAGERTLRGWMRCDWWADVKQEAIDKFLKGLRDKALVAMGACLDTPDDRAGMAKYLGDRLVPQLAPPKSRHEHAGPNGGPLVVSWAALHDGIDDD